MRSLKQELKDAQILKKVYLLCSSASKIISTKKYHLTAVNEDLAREYLDYLPLRS